jgi:starch phosphorylase
MKFMINGALTIGTLDGANVEMREEAGAENFFLFGLNEEVVARSTPRATARRVTSSETPSSPTCSISLPRDVSPTVTPRYLRPVVESLRYHDPFLVCADYRSYVDCQAAVGDAWQDAEAWSRMSILNAARSGKFSSDRAIAEYCDEIWGVAPMKVQV